MRLRRHWFSGLISLAVIVCLWAPLVIVAVNSVNKDTLLVSWKGFTTHWYNQAYHNPDVRGGVKETMTIALASTAISLVLAVSASLWWRRAGHRSQRLFDGLTYLRIMLPEVVFAVALFLLFSKIRFPLGTTAVVIGHVVWNSAYATLIIQARVATLDPALEDAAADLGANPWRVFRRVTFPGLCRDRRGRAARVHVLVRRRGHVLLPGGVGDGTAAGGDPVDDPVPDHTRDQRDRDAGDAVHGDMFTVGFLAVTRLGRGARRALALPEGRD